MLVPVRAHVDRDRDEDEQRHKQDALGRQAQWLLDYRADPYQDLIGALVVRLIFDLDAHTRPRERARPGTMPSM
jgi:hypothetical protein